MFEVTSIRTIIGSEGRSRRPRVFVTPALNDPWLSKQDRPAIKKALMDYYGEDGIVWSQKAGCPCGCSPGFIRTQAALTKWYGDDVHLRRV